MAIATARELFPNATPDQIKRYEAGEIDPAQLIKHGGATKESLKLIFPNALDSQLRRLADGEETFYDLIRHGGATAESLRNAYHSATDEQLERLAGGEDIGQDLFEHGGTQAKEYSSGEAPEPDPNDIGDDNAPDEEDQDTDGVGGDPDAEDELTILKGKDMGWHFDRTSGKWYVSYGLPNSDRRLIFEASPDQMDMLFGEDNRPVNAEFVTFSELSQRDGVTFGGDIAEMEGTGTFEAEFEHVISLALDEGELPSWMEGNDAALDALFIAQTENKSNDWLMEQWAKLPDFKARFPNIDKMQKDGNLNLSEAVDNFLSYEASLKQTAAAFGDKPESITPDMVGGLIDGGYSVKAAQDVYRAYDRMEENSEAMEAFNQILEANGMDPISDLQSMFDFVQGKAPDEYYDLYEASSLQEAANKAGLGDVFEAEDAIDAALRGEHTLDSAHKSMQQAAKLLLRLRHEVDVGKFDLETDELIDISLGQTPSSGRSQAEIQEAINRATLTARASLQGRSKPFTGFSESGTPQKRSLSNLRQQS